MKFQIFVILFLSASFTRADPYSLESLSEYLTNLKFLKANFLQVNADGSAKSAPIMALNETGTSTTGRASVRVPETGNYRFVFIVGTHDLTGGKLAGADMTIDNIVAEEGFTMNEQAIADLLKRWTTVIIFLFLVSQNCHVNSYK